MRISSYDKISKQVEKYMERSMPSIEWLFPDHGKLETKLSQINKQFLPDIHDYCESIRKEKNTVTCFCKLHPTYDKFQALIDPILPILEKDRLEYMKLRNEKREKYETMLIKSKMAKEKYISTCVGN